MTPPAPLASPTPRTGTPTMTPELTTLALAALLLLSALAGWMLFGSADAATPLRPGAQTRDILRAVIPLAFFAWITRDLFIARREGAFDR